MKKFINFIGLVFLVLLLGCSDPVQEELLTYINDDLAELGELEGEAIGTYDSVTGANYTDDFVLYDALTLEIIPIYLEFIGELESVEISSSELREIHENYIDAANNQHIAFTKLVAALENQDANAIEEVNSMLAESRKMMRQYNYDLQELAEKHNVEIGDKVEEAM